MKTLKKVVGGKRVLWLAITMVGLLLFIAGPGSLWAKDFPSDPITIMVPFGPGGLIDIGARIIGDSLSKELKVPVVIENKAGGAGLQASLEYLKRPKDGYTLLAASAAVVISNGVLGKTKTYDPRKAFVPIGHILSAPVAMSVAKSAPFQTYQDFVKYAKANPGKVRGGTSALGGETNIMFRQIIELNKIDCVVVPYSKSAKLIPAIMGGHLEWMTQSVPKTMPYQKSGDVKIVLVTSRAEKLPGVPSGADVGLPDISINMWMGLFAHAQTPKPIYDKLVAAVAEAAKDPEAIKKLVNAGCSVDYKGPQEYSELLKREWGLFEKVFKDSELKVR